MNDTEPRTGYELAAKILATHPDDAIETMLRCSHGTESDWLEFKAGMTLLPEDEKKGFKPDDVYWKYAESIAAMANTFGGAFVIGIDNKHNPVPLSCCDPRKVLATGDADDYIRKEIIDRIAPAEPKPQSWTDYKGVTWKIESVRLASLVEPRQVKFRGENVIVLLVKMTEASEEILITRKAQDLISDLLPHRVIGDVGQVVRLSLTPEKDKYRQERILGSDRYTCLYRQAAPALFICHSSEDDLAADQFRQRLEGNGITCWFAPKNIAGGDVWTDSIDDAIDASTALLVLVSRHSLQSKWVKAEVTRAFNAQKRIIPVKIDNSKVDKGGLRLILSSFQIIDATESEIEAANSVVAALRMPASPDPIPETSTTPSHNPIPQPAPPPSPNMRPTHYDKLVAAFREALVPGPSGVFPILDILMRKPNFNLDFPTFGGNFWWDTLTEVYGWKLQHNKFFGQFRILDKQNFRRAWGRLGGMERMFGISNAKESTPAELGKRTDPARTNISTRKIALLSQLAKRFRETTYPNEEGIAPIIALTDNSPMWNRFIWASFGYWFWETIAESNGWKLQRNKFLKQFRVRDPDKTCRACGWMKTMRLIFFPKLEQRRRKMLGRVPIEEHALRWLGAVLVVSAVVAVYHPVKTPNSKPPVLKEWNSYCTQVEKAFTNYCDGLSIRQSEFTGNMPHVSQRFVPARTGIDKICEALTPEIVNNLVESAVRDKINGHTNNEFLLDYINGNFVAKFFIPQCRDAMEGLRVDGKAYENKLKELFDDFQQKLPIYQRVYLGPDRKFMAGLNENSTHPQSAFDSPCFFNAEKRAMQTSEALANQLLKLGTKEIKYMEERFQKFKTNPWPGGPNPAKIDCTALRDKLVPEVRQELENIISNVQEEALSDAKQAARKAKDNYENAGISLRKAALIKPTAK